MKIAIIGGTGRMGRALGRHLSKKNHVIIGSRDPTRAVEAARGIEGATGTSYANAASEADVVVLAIPYASISEAGRLGKELGGKLVISMVNPTKLEGGLLMPAMESGSAAEELARLLPDCRIATAFNNLSVVLLEKRTVPMDILIAADSRGTYEEVAEIVKGIENLRPLYAGPLSQAGIIERITSLEVNLAKLNGTGSLGTKFVGLKG